MEINYYLLPNTVPTAPDTYKAKIVHYKTMDQAAIIAEMAKRGTTLSRADILAAMDLLYEVVADKLSDGCNVNLDIAKLRPTISGTFHDLEDHFDATRHSIRISATVGSTVAKRIKKVNTRKTTHTAPLPQPQHFQDTASNQSNAVITPGGIAEVYGVDLKFNRLNDNEGVFLIGENETTVQITVFAKASKGHLIFGVPSDLPTGNYHLEVRKIYGTANPQLRKGHLQHMLTVQQ